MSPALSLENKVALVTGGSRGIGRAIALEVAARGAAVVVNYNKSPESAEEVVKQIQAAGGKAATCRADVSDFKQAEALVKFAVETFGDLSILVNNAGITRDQLIMMMPEADWDAVINVNLKGTFNATKAVSRVMLKQHSGKIINIASIIGIIGNPGQANYAASKAGIIALTKTTAKELASRHVTVNAVAPGFIQTAMTDKLPEDIRAKMLSAIPLGRLGNVQDIANACVFLASEDADYITGQTIVVDGGMVMA